MAQTSVNNSLLSALQARYHQVVKLMTRLRLSVYRPRTQLGTGKKLTARLNEFIKQTPVADTKNITSNARKQQNHNLPFDHVTTNINDNSPFAKPDGHHDLETKLILQPTAGENLMRSTWEHLRASIRCAKAGDKKAARLHARIMDSALKEAGHFLDDEVFQEFMQRLEKELASQGR